MPPVGEDASADEEDEWQHRKQDSSHAPPHDSAKETRRPSEPSQSSQIHPHLKRHGVFQHHVAAKCADVHVGVE